MDVTSDMSGHVGVTPTPLFLRVNDVAKTLGLSRREIYRLLDEGVLTGAHYGRMRLIDATCVREFAERMRKGEFAAPLKVGATA